MPNKSALNMFQRTTAMVGPNDDHFRKRQSQKRPRATPRLGPTTTTPADPVGVQVPKSPVGNSVTVQLKIFDPKT